MDDSWFGFLLSNSDDKESHELGCKLDIILI